MLRRARLVPVLLVSALVAGACTSGEGGPEATTTAISPPPWAAPVSPAPSASPEPSPEDLPPSPVEGAPTGPAPGSEATPAPAWLGTRELPRRPDGFGQVQPTPLELVDRRIVTRDILPPPPGLTFRSSVRPVPADVLERSTWHEDCPVAVEDLRYVQVSFWGFDERPHTGELLVAADVAEDIVRVFERIYDARFPIEEMRVVAGPELDLPPTGDGNNTTGFVCRPARGQTSWSQHALARAVDINPFHNPYVKGDLVIPELASSYTDRDDVRPGMIVDGDVVTAAFADIGWGWGGDWTSLTDPMHFSSDGT